MSIKSKADPYQEARKGRTKGEGSIKKRERGRRLNENFEKRKRTLLKKCNETVDKYQADIYIAVRRRGKCTTNCFAVTWPPRGEDIVSHPSLFVSLLILYRKLTTRFLL